MPPTTPPPAALDRVVETLATARAITVLTGAGISAASGVPTFRGPSGLWERYRPEDLATPEAFTRDPALVWRWYDWRRRTLAPLAPNRGHAVIAHWSNRRPGLTVVTQNVDGLHEMANTRDVVRLHGSIWEVRCAASCDRGREPWRDMRVPLPELPPRCAACGSVLRPAIVWFGEALPAAAFTRATAAARCDLFMAIGTSAIVHPAAGLAARAREAGALVVEINPERTAGSELADVALAMPAETALDALERGLALAEGRPPLPGQ